MKFLPLASSSLLTTTRFKTSFFASYFLLLLSLSWNVIPTIAASSSSTTTTDTSICFLVYQMADNNLEYFIRQDLQEIIFSPAVRQPSVTTWVYFDSRNLGDSSSSSNDDDDITKPLPNVYYKNGTSLKGSKKFGGSYYMRYNQTKKKMLIDTVVNGEQDSDNAKTVSTFLKHAIKDCIATSIYNKIEYFLIFSSHGGGFGGFGGDEHERRLRELRLRKLLRQQQQNLEYEIPRNKNNNNNNFGYNADEKLPNQHYNNNIDNNNKHIQSRWVQSDDGTSTFTYDDIFVVDDTVSAGGGTTSTTTDDATQTTTDDSIPMDDGPQPNESIVQAINSTLRSFSSTPSKLSVLGFDACLMMEMGALDDYRNVTDYYLASQATEPGHGFAYRKLSDVSSALNMAKQLQSLFLTETQAGPGEPNVHEVPKTLAVVNTNKFTAFLTAWDAMAKEMLSIVQHGTDPSFSKIVSRARSQTLSFEGYGDTSDTKQPSSVDIGQYFRIFNKHCDINPDSTFKTLFDEAFQTYNATFLVRGTGPGTAKGTGMCITWPTKSTYKSDEEFWDDALFNTSDVYATAATPNFLKFLKLYYKSSSTSSSSASTTRATDSTPVCLANVRTSLKPQYDGQLLLNPDVTFEDDGYGDAKFTSEITESTDYVLVEYGVNVTHLLYKRRMKEKLQHRRLLAPSSSNSDMNDYQPYHNGLQRRRHRRQQLKQLSRRSQYISESDDWYYIYGGEFYIDYEGSNATGTWDRIFYYLEDKGSYEALYVIDKGDGHKSFPVCFFRRDNRITSKNLSSIVDTQTAIDDLGCIEGEIVFSLKDANATGEAQSTKQTLYVYNDDFSALTQLPSFIGGQIAPILYIELVRGDSAAYELVGGLGGTLIDWNKNTSLNIVSYYDDQEIVAYGAEDALIHAMAYDYDLYYQDNSTDSDKGLDEYLFTYSIVGSDNETDQSSNSSGTSEKSSGNQSSFLLSQILLFIITAGHLLTVLIM